MDSPAVSEEMASSSDEQDMEFIPDCLPPQSRCNCGAYDKIMSATSLLRRRIIYAVNNELDQYEQPLGSLLQTSRQRIMTGTCDGPSIEKLENSQSQPSSQSQTLCHAELCHTRNASIDLIVHNILVNASLLLLSKLN
ncbi:hypothetical protein OESDEN_25486 [Oesophagostomum dentatum]|uniref:SERTA domain-containing protein n=1 Tax=Oesophagostomum dentatum TaxID=61180 RepID=A0A0B1RPB8_OESDE|nr:hypothetical protein OESDEN_25486 [Oesophagostomum dentatum]